MLDPFGNYCMARAKWMRGDLDEADGWLGRCLDISPNFTQAHYLRSLIHVMLGEGKTARDGNGIAMALSPLDPLHYAMKATHAMAHINDGTFDQAAAWADRAALSPGCHYLPIMVAAAAQQLKGDRDRARHWVEQVKSNRPDVTIDRFFKAFPYRLDDQRRLLTQAFLDAGFSLRS